MPTGAVCRWLEHARPGAAPRIERACRAAIARAARGDRTSSLGIGATWGTFAEARSLLLTQTTEAQRRMIEWPDESVVTTPEAREGLELVRASGACAELEAQPSRWRVAAWPWTREPPLRVVFFDDANDQAVVTLDADGIWQLETAPVTVRERTLEELEEDARAEQPVLGFQAT